jgi:hypothetical protein
MKITIDQPKDKRNQAKVWGTLESIYTASSLCIPEIINTLKEGLPIFKKMKKLFDRYPKEVNHFQEEIKEVKSFLFTLSGELTYATMNNCPASSFVLEEVHSLIELINYQEDVVSQHVKIETINTTLKSGGVIKKK